MGVRVARRGVVDDLRRGSGSVVSGLHRWLREQNMGFRLQFSSLRPGGDRVHHVREEDVRVVLARLPAEVTGRLRRVHFNDRSRGGRRLGYVNFGRREIALCALPPRVSLTRYLCRRQTPEQFGAIRGVQWSPTAIRRFMLYDVFLHELGHLQTVHAEAKSERRKFAVERKAQEFAMYWCQRLWTERFEHSDPAHNPPTAVEIEDEDPELSDMRVRVGQFPREAMMWDRLAHLYHDRARKTEEKEAWERALSLEPKNYWTILKLGSWHYGMGHFDEAMGLFKHAAGLMPRKSVAYWCMGDVYWKRCDNVLAGAMYEKAVALEPRDEEAKRRLRAWRQAVQHD
jgi:hypothetical protein